jgi:hypothetical protein
MNLRRSITLGLAAAAAFAATLAFSAGAAQATAPSPVISTAAHTLDETGSWPIVDENGVQRSTVSVNWTTGYATACYGDEAGTIRIELRFESGYIQRRVVPQFGCTVASPNGAPSDAGRAVAVRGLVGDFANPWHENV